MPAITLALQLLAITHVTLIDPDVSAVRRDMTIVVRGSHVEAVGASATTTVPAGARVIEGRGKYVIPGMWDMHVHADASGGRALLPLFVAAGVTGVRDMNGSLSRLRGWQREIAAGTLVGPRLVISGPYIIGRDLPPALGMPYLRASDEASATRGVDSLVALGVDFVKVHGFLTPTAYFAAARAARRKGITFAGHVTLPVTPLQASDSGQRSLEHLYAFLNECTPADSAVIARGIALQRYVMGECTSVSQQAMYARLARNRTWVTPTLTVQRMLSEMRVPIVPGDSTAQFYGDSLMLRLAMEMELPPTPPPGSVAAGEALFARRMALVGALHRAGVPILGGTDAPLAVGGPGAGIVGELELLVQSGLTPREALRTVTTEPARYLAADSLGTVARGKVADLVVLDADPLVQVTNLRRIHAVVANGRVFDAAAREALFQAARRAARPAGR
ncbi:MAG: amidohydrolase family protein [Gemmatimonadetes bacterium]|nr:amidohydrolase family protein [Gemmatimonadota bacterium]